MNVDELSSNQLTELKQLYYCDVVRADESVSLGELCDIDRLVSDEEVKEYYAGTHFAAEDFTTT